MSLFFLKKSFLLVMNSLKINILCEMIYFFGRLINSKSFLNTDSTDYDSEIILKSAWYSL